MNDVSLSILLWKIEKMYSQRGMGNVDCNVAYLLKPVGPFVHPQQL